MKHGMGKLTYKDGSDMLGFWQKDRMNGLFKIKKAGFEHTTTVIYKDDMLIMVNDSGVSFGDYVYIGASIFMMLTVYAGIPLGLVVTKELFALCGLYLIYVIWSSCHASTWYRSGLKTLSETFKNISKAIKSPPIVTYHI